MGGIVISPLPAFLPSTCLRRRQCTHLLTTATTTTASSSGPQPNQVERATGKSAPAGDAQYANMHQTALVATSSILTALALLLSTLLPADQSIFVKMGLRVVPMYTLSLHLRTVLLTLFRYQCTLASCPTLPLSVAWLAIATLTAVVWVYEGSMADPLTLEGAAVYIGLMACALLECALLGFWGEGLFVASLPSVRMKVEEAVVESERKLEEGVAKTENKLADGRH